VDIVHLEVNDAFEKLTVLKKSDVLGKRATEAVPIIGEKHPELIPAYGKVALSGAPTSFEIF
jgi:hypothetical protein